MNNQISWFPGHMAKSLRLIEENLRFVDLIIYTLDARAPKSCLTPEFDKLFFDKKIIYVLNKSDLADVCQTKHWINKFISTKSTAISVDSTASKSARPIMEAANKLCGEKLARYNSKGVKATIRALVAGVPNCGKSTLINNLSGAAKTAVANRPGVTRGKQWVRINDYFEVLDTPGTLYPKLNDQTIARRLAFIGSIRDEVTDTVSLAAALLEELNGIDKNIIRERYKADFPGDGASCLDALCKARGYLLKGNTLDTERMAAAVIDDFRKGRLGRITLEKAEDL